MKGPFDVDNEAATLAKTATMLRKDRDYTKKNAGKIEELKHRIADSAIHENYIVCLECGQRLFEISEDHLARHALTMEEYKAVHGYDQARLLQCRAIPEINSLLG